MNLTEQIQELEESLRQAMLSGDVSSLDKLIDSDLLFTGPAGQLVSKAADLENYRSGLQKITSLLPQEQIIRMLNGFAVVSVRMDLKGQFAGQSIDGQYRYGRVWSNRDGSWKIVAGHVSVLQS